MKSIFKSSLGFADAFVQHISGTGVPGGDNSYQDQATLGSDYSDGLTGAKYIKTALLGSVDDWVKLADTVDLNIIRADVVANAQLVAQEATDRVASITSESSARVNAVAGVQSEVDSIESGTGLDTVGGYIQEVLANYIASATSIHNATVLLDGQAKVTSDAVAANAANLASVTGQVSTNSTNATNADAAIQAELDQVETATGLSVSGTYMPEAGASFIASATSVHGATVVLDGQLFTVKSVADAALPAVEKGAASGVASLDASGKLLTSQLPQLAISSVTPVASEAEMFALGAASGDTAVRSDIGKTFIHNGGTAGTISDWTELLTPTDTVMLTEMNAIEAGAGLSSTGAYQPTVTANYISAASSIDDATQLLDAHAKVTDDEIVAVNAAIAANGSGLGAESTARVAQIAAVQSEVDSIEAGAGLDVDGSYTPEAGSNYISGAGSIHHSCVLLDSKLKEGEDSAIAQVAATSAEHATINAAIGNLNYSSTNNFATGDDLTSAVSALDAKLAGTVHSAVVAGVTAAVVDAVPTYTEDAVSWTLSIQEDGNRLNCVSMQILAMNNSDGTVDADDFDWSEYGELELGEIAGLSVSITLAGTGPSQVMELAVTASSAITIRVTRILV